MEGWWWCVANKPQSGFLRDDDGALVVSGINVELDSAERVSNHPVTFAEADIPLLVVDVPAGDRPIVLELSIPRAQQSVGTVPGVLLIKVFDGVTEIGAIAWKTFEALNRPEPIVGRCRVPASATDKQYKLRGVTDAAGREVIIVGTATEKPLFDAVVR